jgi:hypothetical protein
MCPFFILSVYILSALKNSLLLQTKLELEYKKKKKSNNKKVRVKKKKNLKKGKTNKK